MALLMAEGVFVSVEEGKGRSGSEGRVGIRKEGDV